MSFRDEEDEMRREFERTMNAAFRSMLQPPLGFPSLLRPPPSFFPTPLAQDPFGTFPILRPAPPSYIDIDADDNSEEEMMRRALEESKKAEEERRRKQMEQEREIIDVDAMEDEEELLRQGLAASLEDSTSSPLPEKMEGLEEEDEELQRALAASVSADRERRQAEEKRRQEELRKQQEERALSHQDSEVDADSEADLMQAIAASLEAEREAKKKREAEKQRQETALLEERVRNLVGDMHGIFNTKESDVPMPQAVPEGERRERLKRQAETDERQLLREQQDEEFRASLERDRLVEREKKRKEEQESRAKWEQERKEAEAKRKKEELERRKQERVDEMKRKATTLPEEPQPKDASAAELVCRLPTGKRVGRRFLKGAKLEVVKDWVDSVLAEDIEANWAKEKETEEGGTEQPQVQQEAAEEEEKEMFYGYDLVSDFPRKTFSDLSMTIEQAGLAPRALISVAMH